MGKHRALGPPGGAAGEKDGRGGFLAYRGKVGLGGGKGAGAVHRAGHTGGLRTVGGKQAGNVIPLHDPGQRRPAKGGGQHHDGEARRWNGQKQLHGVEVVGGQHRDVCAGGKAQRVQPGHAALYAGNQLCISIGTFPAADGRLLRVTATRKPQQLRQGGQIIQPIQFPTGYHLVVIVHRDPNPLFAHGEKIDRFPDITSGPLRPPPFSLPFFSARTACLRPGCLCRIFHSHSCIGPCISSKLPACRRRGLLLAL